VGKKGIGVLALISFSLCPKPPPPLLSLPTQDLVFWAKNINRCPPKPLNVKLELLNYHYTVLFLPKIQGWQSSHKISSKSEIQGEQCPPKLFPGWQMPTLPTQCWRPWV